MKGFKILTTVAVMLFLLTSCNNSDNGSTYAPINYINPYYYNIRDIENYLKTHAVTVTNNPGFADDQDATFAEVPELSENSIWGSDPDVPKTSLRVKSKTIKGIDHKIYYLKFREGSGASPTANSQLKCAYQGLFLDGEVFETSPAAGTVLHLNQLILGWQEILPEFKMGTVTGTDHYEDFGAGVMFLPSALGYYDNPPLKIPAYSPLIFSFKLYNVL